MTLEKNFAATLDCQKEEQVSPRTNEARTISGSKNNSYFGHIMRKQDCLEKIIMLGKV